MDMILHPGTHFRRAKAGQSRFMAETDMRVPAMPSASRGSSLEKSTLPESATPKIHIADLALLDIDALLAGIDPQPQQETVEDQRARIERLAEASTTVPPEP